jgi:anaerobic selenocysteine-containing dehydrogenase
MVERRDLLKGIGAVAAATATVTAATETAEAQASMAFGPYATP